MKTASDRIKWEIAERAGEMFDSDGQATGKKWDEGNYYGRSDFPEPTEDWVGIMMPTAHIHGDDILSESNYQAMKQWFGSYEEEDVQYVRLRYWGESILVRIDSDAFGAFCNLVASLENYPLLDEDDHSQRQWKAQQEACPYSIQEFIKKFTNDDYSWHEFYEQLQRYEFADLLNWDDNETCRETSDFDALAKLILYDLEMANEDVTDEIETIIMTAYFEAGRASGSKHPEMADSALVSRQINTIEDNARWVERSNYRTDRLAHVHGLAKDETFCRYCAEQIQDTTEWAYEFHELGQDPDGWRDFAHVRCCHMRIDFDINGKDEEGKIREALIELIREST